MTALWREAELTGAFVLIAPALAASIASREVLEAF